MTRALAPHHARLLDELVNLCPELQTGLSIFLGARIHHEDETPPAYITLELTSDRLAGLLQRMEVAKQISANSIEVTAAGYASSPSETISWTLTNDSVGFWVRGSTKRGQIESAVIELHELLAAARRRSELAPGEAGERKDGDFQWFGNALLYSVQEVADFAWMRDAVIADHPELVALERERGMARAIKSHARIHPAQAEPPAPARHRPAI